MHSIFKKKFIIFLIYIISFTSATKLFAVDTFSEGVNDAALYGTHEVYTLGNKNSNIYFTFTNNNTTLRVHGFYDGSGKVRARLYCNKVGTWNWTTSDGSNDGTFSVVSSNLKGKLKASGKFIVYDNDNPFISIVDTAYHLFNEDKAHFNNPTDDNDFKTYIEDIVNHGATMVRIGVLGGIHWDSSGQTTIPGREILSYYYTDDSYETINYDNFKDDDKKIQWILSHYQDLQIQLILLGSDNDAFYSLGKTKRDKLIQYMIDRYAAYPNIIFMVQNDAMMDTSSSGTHKIEIAKDGLKKLKENDPFHTLRSTGYVRLKIEYPERIQRLKELWTEYFKQYSTYMHLETDLDYAADNMDIFRDYNQSVPILGMEDWYEGYKAHEPYEFRGHEELYYRRASWSWILSGSGFAYGGNWWETTPYTRTSPRLKGMDDLIHITDFFKRYDLNITDYVPDDNLATNGLRGKNRVQATKSEKAYLIYNPYADNNINLVENVADGTYEHMWYDCARGYSTPFLDTSSNNFHKPSSISSTDVVLFIRKKGSPIPSEVAHIVSPEQVTPIPVTTEFQWEKDASVVYVDLYIWDLTESKEIYFAHHTTEYNKIVELPAGHRIKVFLTSFDYNKNKIKNSKKYYYDVEENNPDPIQLAYMVSPDEQSILSQNTLFRWDKGSASKVRLYVKDISIGEVLTDIYTSNSEINIGIPQNGHQIRVYVISLDANGKRMGLKKTYYYTAGRQED